MLRRILPCLPLTGLLASGCVSTSAVRYSDDYFIEEAQWLNSALNKDINHVEYDVLWNLLEKQAHEEERYRRLDRQQQLWMTAAAAGANAYASSYQATLDARRQRRVERRTSRTSLDYQCFNDCNTRYSWGYCERVCAY